MYLVPRPQTTLTPPRLIAGRSLAHRRLTASERAALAAMVSLGEAKLEQLTTQQLARIFGVSPTYIQAARKLSPTARRWVCDGLDLCHAPLIDQLDSVA